MTNAASRDAAPGATIEDAAGAAETRTGPEGAEIRGERLVEERKTGTTSVTSTTNWPDYTASLVATGTGSHR